MLSRSPVRWRSVAVAASLRDFLARRIRLNGPLTVHAFMRETLTHPRFGYYMTRDVFGQKGDFITSPEISQVFGELIGVWIVNEWSNLAVKSPLHIVELGPGRGTLAMDILRVLRNFPQISRPVSLHLVEVSPMLAYLQEAVLRGKPLPREPPPNLECSVDDTGAGPYKSVQLDDDFSVFWYSQLEDVPQECACYLGHEFLDALPIHKFQKKDGRWLEVFIDYSEKDDTFSYVLSPGATKAIKAYLPLLDVKPSVTEVEFSPEAGVCMESIAHRLSDSGGIALMIDYGHEGEKGDTFRAFREHRLEDPLRDPGTADLTADVNFAFLAAAVRRAQPAVRIFGPVTQGSFLGNMGIGVRLQMLLQSCQSPEQRRLLVSGCEKLVSPKEMGERFKFLALHQPLGADPTEEASSYRPAGFPLESRTF